MFAKSSSASDPLPSSSEETRIYVGIDVSLSDTGFATIDQWGNILVAQSIKTESGNNDFTRCMYTTSKILDLLDPYIHDHTVNVFVESIPFSRNPNGKLFTRHELMGMIKLRLSTLGLPVYMIGPTTLKNRFAGKGNSGKDAIQSAVYNRFHRLIKNDNVADAVALAGLGSDYIDRGNRFSIERLPKVE